MEAAHYANLYGWVYAHRDGYGGGHGQSFVPVAAAWLKGGGTLVDAGCGRQQFNAALQPLAPSARLYGLDVVGAGPAPAGVTFVQSPMWDLSGVTERIDVVTSWDALEHLEPEDVGRTLDEWAARLRPGGRLACTIATYPSGILGPEGVNLHPTVRPKAWWAGQLAARFSGVRYVGPWWEARA